MLAPWPEFKNRNWWFSEFGGHWMPAGTPHPESCFQRRGEVWSPGCAVVPVTLTQQVSSVLQGTKSRPVGTWVTGQSLMQFHDGGTGHLSPRCPCDLAPGSAFTGQSRNCREETLRTRTARPLPGQVPQTHCVTHPASLVLEAATVLLLPCSGDAGGPAGRTPEALSLPGAYGAEDTRTSVSGGNPAPAVSQPLPTHTCWWQDHHAESC